MSCVWHRNAWDLSADCVKEPGGYIRNVDDAAKRTRSASSSAGRALKRERQQLIADLAVDGGFTSQQELVELLTARGFDVTPKRRASSRPTSSVTARSRIVSTLPSGIDGRNRSRRRSSFEQKLVLAVNWMR